MKRPNVARAGFLLVAVLVAYWPAVHGGFLFDDDALVSQSRLAQAPDGLRRIWLTAEPIDYWPVTNTSFWLEWRLWGLRPTGYHVTNILVHAASALLLWSLLARLRVPGAFWGALIFALHPVNVQSVAWIAQRKNTLSMLFLLLSALSFLRGESASAARTPAPTSSVRPPDRWYWSSLGFFVVALLSKGSVAVLPGLLLAILWWRNGALARRDVLAMVPFVAVAAAFTFVNIWFQGRGGEPIRDLTMAQRLAGAGAAVWFYLSKAVAPVRLTFMYPEWDIRPDEWRWWIPLAAAAAVTAALWRARRRSSARAGLTAWLCFCLALVPVLGLVDVYFMKYTPVADHYEYIALIVVAACAGAAIASLRAQAVRVLAGAVVVATVGAATWGQAHLYADPEVLYRATLERNPSAWALQNNLGALLIDRGRDEEAVAHLREGLRLNPQLAAAHTNLCLANIHLARYDGAMLECSEAVRDNPTLAMPHVNLGIALMAFGRLGEAEPQLRTGLGIEPDYPEAHYNLGHLLLVTGRAREAVPHLREVLEKQPDSAAARNELGLALDAAGEPAQAEAAFREAVRRRPDFGEAHRNLANLLQRLGRTEEAAVEYGKARANGR